MTGYQSPGSGSMALLLAVVIGNERRTKKSYFTYQRDVLPLSCVSMYWNSRVEGQKQLTNDHCYAFNSKTLESVFQFIQHILEFRIKMKLKLHAFISRDGYYAVPIIGLYISLWGIDDAGVVITIAFTFHVIMLVWWGFHARPRYTIGFMGR